MKYTDPTAFENHLRKQASHQLSHTFLIVSKDSYVQKKMASSVAKTVSEHQPNTEVLRLTLEGGVEILAQRFKTPLYFRQTS